MLMDLHKHQLVYKIETQHRGESSFTDITTAFAGCSINRKVNIASSCRLTLSNVGWPRTWNFYPGDLFRIYLGWNTVPDNPTFYGHKLPIGNSSNELTTSLSLVDFMGQLKSETIWLDDDLNYDNWEASAALGDITLSLDGTPLEFAGTGPSPRAFITSEMNLRSNWETKKSVFDRVLNAMNEGFSVWEPKQFYAVQKNFGRPAVTLIKTPDLESDVNVDYNVDDADNLLRSDITDSFMPVTSTAISGRQVEFADTDTTTRHGVYSERAALRHPGEYGQAKVEQIGRMKQLRKPFSSNIFKLQLLEAPYLDIGNVLEIDDSRLGLTGKHLITQQTIQANMKTVSNVCELTSIEHDLGRVAA